MHSAEDVGPSWEWAHERLLTARNYWLSTASAEHGPHARPVWAVGSDDGLLFTAGRDSRKMQNLRVDPRVSVHAELVREVVVVSGRVEEVVPPPAQVEAYRAKYGWLPPDTQPWFLARTAEVHAASEGLHAGRSTTFTF